jgi:AMMECR1 domain-containing protein
MLLVIARKKLEEYIRNRNVPKADVKEPILLEKCGAVITLIKNSSLRECIGYIQPAVPLHKTISDMAIATRQKIHVSQRHHKAS